MGKKTRKSRAGAATEAETGMPRAVIKDVMDIVNVLLEKCSNPFGAKGRDWEEYVEVYQLVDKLRKKQAAYVMGHPDRAAGFPAFLTWLKQHNVDLDAVSIDKFDVGGYGLKANRDIKESELFLSVPYKLMMTTLTAKNSMLGPLIKGDCMLQSMPSVTLSLHVLCERAVGNSFWASYINILPDSYDTPLYFSMEEVRLLKGSPAFSEAMNQLRNISRQYAYFFKQFQAIDDVLKLPIRNMCFDDYRWAVATVMTRQNQIPNRRGEQTVISLIPLWDMCNHDNGHVTTDYDLKKDCTMCYSLREFKKDDQVFIFYGERSNADLLVHNGFIFPGNDYDKLNIKLGISKNDHLYAMKSEVLSRLSLLPSRVFGLQAGPDPVDSSLVAYLRVFCMDQGALDARLRGENASKLLRQLRDFGLLVSVDNEKKCWNFLETRAQLLLKTYPTSAEEDEQLLASPDALTPHGRTAVSLRLGEKRILATTMEFARAQRTEVDDLVRQHLEQLSLGMNDLGGVAAGDEDGDDLAGLSLAPQHDDVIGRGVVIEEIDGENVPGVSEASDDIRRGVLIEEIHEENVPGTSEVSAGVTVANLPNGDVEKVPEVLTSDKTSAVVSEEQESTAQSPGVESRVSAQPLDGEQRTAGSTEIKSVVTPDTASTPVQSATV